MNQPSTQSLEDIPLVSRIGRRSFTTLLRTDRLGFLQRLSRCGDLARIPLLDKNVVVVTGPAQLQEVLVENAAALEKAAFQRYALYPLVGEGLFTSGGPLWRRQRRLMAPIFSPAQIAQFADSMVACAQRAADSWRDGATLDLARETTRVAMNIAGKTLFDAETLTEADEIGAALTVALAWAGDNTASLLPLVQIALRKALERMAGHLPGRAGERSRSLAARMHGPVLLLGAGDRRMKNAVALLDRRVQRMIDERRAAGQDRPDLLGRLLAAQEEGDGAAMSDRQVRDEVLTLFVAGHETTASALGWSLYLLARHPEVYRRARCEADALGRPPRYEDLPLLQLLLRVFKESLRLYPPVPVFVRDAAVPLQIGGYHLPVGSTLMICPYATHHRADLWPDPERFDPDRFTPEAEAARPRHAFLPFSGGPRVCIGNHFALMEGPLVLATLLQRADFADLALRDGLAVEPEMQATLRPKGGIPMQIRLRSAPAQAPRSGAVCLS